MDTQKHSLELDEVLPRFGECQLADSDESRLASPIGKAPGLDCSRGLRTVFVFAVRPTGFELLPVVARGFAVGTMLKPVCRRLLIPIVR